MNAIENLANKYLEPANMFNLDFPLLTIFDKDIFGIVGENKEFYTVYLLQDRTFVKNRKLADVREVLITDFEYEDMEKLLNKEISLYSFLENVNKYSIGKINQRQFPMKEIHDIKEIKNRIVDKEIYLTLPDKYIEEILAHVKNIKR